MRGDDVSHALLALLCNDAAALNPRIGDALESASPLDISFWPTHPTVDRLYHWRRINGFANETWVDDAARSVELGASSDKNAGDAPLPIMRCHLTGTTPMIEAARSSVAA